MTTRKSTEERRREIADAAIKIIGERGLREFTAAHIAHEVGIKDGTIFRHFKDMNEITSAVLDRLQELLEAAPRFTGDPLERLEGFVLSRLHSVTVQRGIQSLLFSDQLSHALGAEGLRRVAALRNRGRELVRSCLREAGEKGLLREDLDIEGAVVLVTGMVMGFLFAATDSALPAPAGEMEQRCWQTLRSALAREQVLS
ncbi:MAG: TetR/AcrR family transcriptional regulator [Proteobacteria bacterium]|jgi:AcrR family transcriptional regulator|nr:TetR/AcrR family transcriptional regulator [Pseudomonadota bacterium]